MVSIRNSEDGEGDVIHGILADVFKPNVDQGAMRCQLLARGVDG